MSSPDESTTVAPDSPCSPAETSTSTSSHEQQEQEQQQQLYEHHHSQFQQQQQRTTGSAPAAALHVAEDSGAPCEMRRTPPQNKGESVCTVLFIIISIKNLYFKFNFNALQFSYIIKFAFHFINFFFILNIYEQ